MTVWKWIRTKKMKFTRHMVYFRHFRHDIFHCVAQFCKVIKHTGPEVKLLSHMKSLCSFPNGLRPQHEVHWLSKVRKWISCVKSEGGADIVEEYLTHATLTLLNWAPYRVWLVVMHFLCNFLQQTNSKPTVVQLFSWSV